jgi:hypothetical protein
MTNLSVYTKSRVNAVNDFRGITPRGSIVPHEMFHNLNEKNKIPILWQIQTQISSIQCNSRSTNVRTTNRNLVYLLQFPNEEHIQCFTI